MNRLTLKQRRDVRFEIQFIVTMAKKPNVPDASMDQYIETLIDYIDYKTGPIEPPRWQQRLRERMN